MLAGMGSLYQSNSHCQWPTVHDGFVNCWQRLNRRQCRSPFARSLLVQNQVDLHCRLQVSLAHNSYQEKRPKFDNKGLCS